MGDRNVHWPKPTMLPSHPLLRNLVLVALVGEAQLVLGVVVFGDIIQDGQALKHGEIAPVVVEDGGDAAVGADLGVPGLLLGVLHNVDGLVGDFVGESLGAVELFEFFEEDGDFVAVGCAQGEDFEAGGGDGAGWFGHFFFSFFFFFFFGGGPVCGGGGGAAAVEARGR